MTDSKAIKKWLAESYGLAKEKVEREGKPAEIFGLSDGIKLAFFALSYKLSATDFLAAHDELNRLHAELVARFRQ